MPIALVEDVLDSQLLDRRKRKIGKVDGIVLILEEGKPPRAAFLESGAEVAASNVHPRLGRLVAWLRDRLGGGFLQTVRIPFGAMRHDGIDVVVDEDGDEIGSYFLEKWIADRVLAKIPGSGK
jgi:hypothetical protein